MTPMFDRAAQITLFISEKLNEGISESCLYYGDEGESGSFVIPLFFSSTHSMDIFASQFTSLMLDEGYCIASDRVVPTALNTGGESSSHSRVLNNATPGNVDFPAPALISGLSPLMCNPSAASLSAHNATRLPSQNILSRGNLLPTENISSTMQFPGSWISKSQLDIAAPVCAPQWQMILNNHAHLLQLQMQQRERKQKLTQGKLLAGGLGVAASGRGTVQPNGGIQGLADVNIGSFSNLMGMDVSSPMLMGGRTTWIGSGSQSSNIYNNISGSSESKQLLGLINHPAVDIAKMRRAAETQGRASVRVVPLEGSGNGMPMDALNPQSMAFDFSNQWRPQPQLQEHLHVGQPQEYMKSLLQPPALTSLVENLGLPTSQVTLQRYNDRSPN